MLERGLEVLAERIRSDLGIDVGHLSGGGAGGGTGAGLVAFFGAELRPGFDLVSEAIGLEDSIAGADLVLTGEGRIDEGTKAGKAPVGVARLCRANGLTCIAIAGELALPPAEVKRLGFEFAGCRATVHRSAGPGRGDHRRDRTPAAPLHRTRASQEKAPGTRQPGRGYCLGGHRVTTCASANSR